MILKILGGILIYSLLIHLTITQGVHRDFFPIRVTPPEAANNILVFLFLGVALWIVYDILRYVIKIATIPINLFSMGVVHTLLNIAILYTLPTIFNWLYPDVLLQMGSFIEVALFSLGLGVVRAFIK